MNANSVAADKSFVSILLCSNMCVYVRFTMTYMLLSELGNLLYIISSKYAFTVRYL